MGSSEECGVRLSHPTVSRRHARIVVTDTEARIEDLRSRNGTRVAGHRVEEPTALIPGTELAFGTLSAQIEEVADSDLDAAVSFESDQPPPHDSHEPSPGTTAAMGSHRALIDKTLPRLLAHLEAGDDPFTMAQTTGGQLFDTLPCASVRIAPVGKDEAILFTAQRASGDVTEINRSHGPYTIRVGFVHPSHARGYARLVDVAARLLALARPTPVASEPASNWQVPAESGPPTVDEGVKRLLLDARKVARGSVSVLISGESGTGKEVLARFIHSASPRHQAPFIALNCAALPRDLLEAELFGIEQGVATGVNARAGKFELADEGTLFLDEIGDMALDTQARILRVLQEREVYRLGSRAPRSADVRVLAATNRDISTMLSTGEFRNDLYHRIADWTVELPPLRRRIADIPNLAAHFLRAATQLRGTNIAGISQGAVDALVAFAWPGNIRQLEREMARAALFLDEGELLQSSHLQEIITQGTTRENLSSTLR